MLTCIITGTGNEYCKEMIRSNEKETRLRQQQAEKQGWKRGIYVNFWHSTYLQNDSQLIQIFAHLLC